MNLDLISRLRCPQTAQSLFLDPPHNEGLSGKRLEHGYLVSQCGTYRYPIVNGIPRFVPASNYADNFGMQWRLFSKTQLDSYSGLPISADRFWSSTNWSPEEIKGKWVLDIGCGAGRFAEIALLAGAKVVALDYSSAVDACYSNLKHFPNLHVIQGDIYSLPFLSRSFDFVYSLGVLQHTPDVAKAFMALPAMLGNDGKICVDFYKKSITSWFLPKYWLRPITKRLPKERLFAFIERLVPAMLSLSSTIGMIPFAGKVLQRIIPIANYEKVYALDKKQLREWALLDTFDWLAPAYDNPQTPETVERWLSESKLSHIEVLSIGHLIGRGNR